ncbi:Nramp family divalent metal transporter [Trinickia diaoshuihuensis]|uniref:Nramp family divalent metal transporter n=1 Tax=Trinickia diaoshuihuensis TaxID=2292265 RepID=UPI000E25CC89|nr:Nramp family divalent metal transporter [Trinickia diaoshuihuensis]
MNDTPVSPRERTWSARTTLQLREALTGHRRGIRFLLPFAGPAVVVSVAYIDPGNLATNLQAGAAYGYALLWAVLFANGAAMLFQAVSARVGVATGVSLAKLCAHRLPRSVVWAMWGVSEIAAMATDLAEFLGGAIGFSLLARIPLLVGMGITAALTWALLSLQRRGYRPIELAIGALVGLIAVAYVAQLAFVSVPWQPVLRGLFVPTVPDGEALLVCAGIVGATIMPHALFLHSGLSGERIKPQNEQERAKLVRYANAETIIALTVAGLVNIGMVVMACGAFHHGHPEVTEIGAAYRTLTPLFGSMAAGLFLTALMASGISSSVVGTMAGQMIMQDFLGVSLPLWLRRLVTMAPSFLVVASGVGVTRALVLSQVVLSFAVPVPMLALIGFASSRDVMGEHRLGRALLILAVTIFIIVVAMNATLLVRTWPFS